VFWGGASGSPGLGRIVKNVLSVNEVVSTLSVIIRLAQR